MITVNGWCAGGRGEQGNGEMSFQSMGEMGKTSVQTFSKLFSKTLTEGAVTAEAGSLFRYVITLTEKAGNLLRR